MVVGLTQSLIEMSTENISWGVKADALTTSPPSCADCLEIWEPQPSSGPSMACNGVAYIKRLEPELFFLILSHPVYKM